MHEIKTENGSEKGLWRSLGHSSSKTTEVYTHIIAIVNKNVQSPLDMILNNNTLAQEGH